MARAYGSSAATGRAESPAPSKNGADCRWRASGAEHAGSAPLWFVRFGSDGLRHWCVCRFVQEDLVVRLLRRRVHEARDGREEQDQRERIADVRGRLRPVTEDAEPV